MPSGPRRKPSEGTRYTKQILTTATKITVSVSTNTYTTWAPGKGTEGTEGSLILGSGYCGPRTRIEPRSTHGYRLGTRSPRSSLPACPRHTHTETRTRTGLLGSPDSSPTCRPSTKQVVIPATWLPGQKRMAPTLRLFPMPSAPVLRTPICNLYAAHARVRPNDHLWHA